MEKFQKAPFEEIAAHCESKVSDGNLCTCRVHISCFTWMTLITSLSPQANMLHDRLAQIFELTIR